MSMSRFLGILRASPKFLSSKKTLITQIRQKAEASAVPQTDVWCYRAPKPRPQRGNADFKFWILAELAGGLMWHWILFHLYYDYGHLIGEYPLPDPNLWTDEELGIPKTLRT